MKFNYLNKRETLYEGFYFQKIFYLDYCFCQTARKGFVIFHVTVRCNSRFTPKSKQAVFCYKCCATNQETFNTQ